MPRYRTGGPEDEPTQDAGDNQFVGINAKDAPDKLQPGFCSWAVNLRFRDGRPTTRAGAVKLPWSNKVDPSLSTFVQNYAAVYGAEVFSDPDEISWVIIAADGLVYRTRENNASAAVGLPPQTSINSPVFFVQAFGQFVMFRGSRLIPLVMSSVDRGFVHPIAGDNFSSLTAYAVQDLIVWPRQPGTAWDADTTYGAGDLISFGGTHWTAVSTTSAAESPATTPAKWTDIQWLSDVSYEVSDIVIYQASLFECILPAAPAEDPLSAPEKWSPVTSKVYVAGVVTLAGDTPDNSDKWTEFEDVMPYADSGIFMQNRLFIPHSRDLVAASDYQNLALYQSQLQDFRINQGSSDKLVALSKFSDNTIIAFKENSINVVENVYNNLQDIELDEVTREWGLLAPKAVVRTPNGVWFLSQRGVDGFTLNDQGKLKAVDVPWSAMIDPIIKRINPRLASQSVAAFDDNKFYLAVPLDDGTLQSDNLATSDYVYDPDNFLVDIPVRAGQTYRWEPGANDASLFNVYERFDSAGEFVALENRVTLLGQSGGALTCKLVRQYREVNNAVLVFDFIAGAWSGFDTGEAVMVKHWFKTTYNSATRLFFVGFDGYVSLYEEGAGDMVQSDPVSDTSGLKKQEIESRLLSRAYRSQDQSSRWKQVTLEMATWSPEFYIRAVSPGVNEVQALWTGVTRSPTKYFKPFNAPSWDPSNDNDDHGNSHREDYSISLGDDGIDLGSGIQLDAMQNSLWRKRLHLTQPSIQIEIINSSGRIRLNNLSVSAQLGPRKEGVIA